MNGPQNTTRTAEPVEVIDVSGLTKAYGSHIVVNNVSLQVAKGRIFGFLGPNGSGKTTTIRLLCGLLTPDKGQGTCLGFDIRTEQKAIKRRLGYMTQHFSLYGDLTVRENLNFTAGVFSVPDATRRVNEMIAQFGLGDYEDHLVETLSGGWKQRAALAACILHEPELLLLDEPTAGVDPKARRDFWVEIHRLAASGITVLVSTHYMDEAERCHDLGFIFDGQIIARGTVEDLLERSGLTSYTVTGEGVQALEDALPGLPGVDFVTPFGTSLHVSGRDAKKLKKAIAPFENKDGLKWRAGQPTIEDVFIQLLSDHRNTKSKSAHAEKAGS